MTEFNKYKVRQHWRKWGVVYCLVATMLFFVLAIGLEARGII